MSLDMKRFLYHSWLKDLQTLEEMGVYIETSGDCLKGTVYSVVDENLATYGLAGFSECFISAYFCRFYLANQKELQNSDIIAGSFEMRKNISAWSFCWRNTKPWE